MGQHIDCIWIQVRIAFAFLCSFFLQVKVAGIWKFCILGSLLIAFSGSRQIQREPSFSIFPLRLRSLHSRASIVLRQYLHTFLRVSYIIFIHIFTHFLLPRPEYASNHKYNFPGLYCDFHPIILNAKLQIWQSQNIIQS